MSHLKLYNYFRSSTSFRVRIALCLKNLDYDYIPVHLLNHGGEQNQPAYRAINPMGGVPSLVDKDLPPIAQSSAIIEYLDEAFPQTYPLLPQNPYQRAKIREFCQIINADTHAYGNLKTLQFLEKNFGASQDKKNEWVQHWINSSLAVCEKILLTSAGKFCFGDQITAADVFLIPQIFTAQRFGVNTDQYPTITKIYNQCMQIDGFQKAHPLKQIDTPEDLKK